MSLFNKFKTLDQKFSWSFLGFIIALIFGAIGIYTTFFYEKEPSVSYQIISNTQVLDIREKVKNLDVIFEGKSIRDAKQNLLVIDLRIVNDGSINITKELFDENNPLGLKVINGEIIESTLLESSSNYLKNNVKFRQPDKNLIYFNSFMFDTDEYFSLKILLIHSENSEPKIIPIGKISGIKSINIESVYERKESPGLFELTFNENIWVNGFRLVAYPILLVLLILAIVLPMILISETKDKIIRKRIVKKFEKINDVQENSDNLFLFQLFIRDGKHTLLVTEHILNNFETLAPKLMKIIEQPETSDERISISYRSMPNEIHPHFSQDYFAHIFQKLIDNSFITKKEDVFIINTQLQILFNQFIKYLKTIGVIRKDDKIKVGGRLMQKAT